jgi:PAS domain S-box-containing protein
MVNPVSVLLIDESKKNAGEIVSTLRESGHTINFEQVDSREAFSLALKKLDWDLIISADRLKDFGPKEALAFLREKELDIPFLVVVDHIPDDEIDDLFRTGASDCIPRRRLARLGAILKRELRYKGIRRDDMLLSGDQTTEAINRQVRPSGENFRLLTENLRDLIWTADLNLQTTYVSQSVEKILGIPADKYLEFSLEQRFTPETNQRLRKLLIEELEKEKDPKVDRNRSILLEVDHYHADGRILTLEVHVSISRDENGNIIGLQGVTRDITERKRLEAALESRIVALTRPLDQPESIEIEDLFDLETLQRFQDEFSSATGVASIITRPDGTPITRPSKFCRLCQEIIRLTDKGRINCFKSDAEIGRHHPEGPIIQPCMSGGLWDAGAGISVGGRHIANWLIGQVRDETQTEEGIRAYALDIGADETEMVDAFNEVPSMTREQFNHVARLLFTTANQLSNLAYQNVQQARFIAENRKVEDDRRASEQNFREVFNSTSEAIFIDEAETGKIIDVNDTVLRMYGYDSKEAVIAGNIGDLSANEEPFTEDRAQELVRKAIQEGPQVFEWLAKKRDGTRFWSEVSLKKSTIGGSDRVLAVVRDISERKEIEENLRKSEKLFRSLFEMTAVGVAITNAGSGKYLHANNRFCEITGFHSDELKSLTWTSMTHPDDLPVNTDLMECLKAGSIRNFSLEKRYIKKDGSSIWVEVSVAPMWEPGEEPGSTIAVVQDITARKESEQALRASEERFRRLSEDIPVCISSFLPDSTCTYLNTAQAGLLGKTAEQVLGQKFLDLLSLEDQAMVKQKLAGLNPSNPTETHEQKHILPDGSERIIEWRNRAFFDEHGNTTHFLGVGVDITERKAMFSALRESEEKFSTAFHVSPDSININRLTDGLFIDINEGFSALTGYTVDDVKGKSSLDLDIWVNPEDRQRLVNGLRESGQVINLEAPFRFKNGEIKTGLMSARIIEVNGEFCILSITRDITDRKRIEVALQKSEERYQLIDEASQDLIYSYDREGRFTHANSSLCRLLGLRPEEILGKTHAELGFPPEQCEEWERLHRQVYETNSTVIAETQTPIQDGQPLYFEVVLNPIHDETGSIIGIAGTTRDINQRKLAELKIEEQLDELRRWHHATLGREKRILELKREVNRLLVEAGKPHRYASPGEGGDG